MADLTHSASTVKVNANHLQPSGKAKPLERAVHQLLAFLIGALIPFISWRTELGGAAATFSERVAIVDVVALILIFLFILKGIKFTLSAVLYVASLLISLFIANVSAVDNSEWSQIIVSAVALFVAFGYWIVGYNIGLSRTLTRYLLSGLFFSFLIEFIIVAHDFISPVQLFPDQMLGRVRGSFRANGQLGAYAYAMAGIIFIFGLNWSRKLKFKYFSLLLGFASIFMVAAASRRSAIFSLAIWLAIYLSISVFHFKLRHFAILTLILIVVSVSLSVYSDELGNSFTTQRIVEALESMETGDNFTLRQFETAVDYLSEWFPLGVGVGRWWRNFDYTEIHNGHLSLLVEIGLAGLLTYYSLMYLPIMKNKNISPLVKYAIMSFIIASLVMMIHNRLYRDRVFMLTLGLLTNYAVAMHEPSETTAP